MAVFISVESSVMAHSHSSASFAASATLSRRFSRSASGLHESFVRDSFEPSPPQAMSIAAFAASTGSVTILIAELISFPNILFPFVVAP